MAVRECEKTNRREVVLYEKDNEKAPCNGACCNYGS